MQLNSLCCSDDPTMNISMSGIYLRTDLIDSKCQSDLLTVEYWNVSNETNTDVHICTLLEFIVIDVASLLYEVEVIGMEITLVFIQLSE